MNASRTAACLALALIGARAAVAGVEDDAREVYIRIARAAGESRQPPGLIVKSDAQAKADGYKRRIAWYDPETNSIGIDRRTLDMCAKMPDTRGCIAVFLGHELAHFYKDHRWGADFGSRFSATNIGVQVKALSAGNLLIYEAQADDVGGLYSYLAGYDTLAMAPAVLERIYAEYKLPAVLPGYPSLAERENIAKSSVARLEALVPVFESGNLLLALARYEDAARCFDRVAATLPGGAELNNAGVAWVLEAARLFPRESNAGGYPWTLDGESRLEPRKGSQSRAANTESTEEKRKRLTDAALSRFEEAMRSDPAYLPAKINLAFLEHLMGKRGSARDRMAGISGSASGEPAAAIARAKAIVGSDAPPSGGGIISEQPPAWVRIGETISQQTPGRVDPKNLATSVVLPPDSAQQESLRVLSRRYPDYWAIVIESGKWQAKALITAAAYKGETAQHVTIGMDWEAAMKAYAQTPDTQSSSLGRIAVFPGIGLAIAGSTGVTGWFVFSAPN